MPRCIISPFASADGNDEIDIYLGLFFISDGSFLHSFPAKIKRAYFGRKWGKADAPKMMPSIEDGE